MRQGAEEASREAQARKPAVRVRVPERRQMAMVVQCADDLVAAQHPVRMVMALVETLDLTRFCERIKARDGVAGAGGGSTRAGGGGGGGGRGWGGCAGGGVGARRGGGGGAGGERSNRAWSGRSPGCGGENRSGRKRGGGGGGARVGKNLAGRSRA